MFLDQWVRMTIFLQCCQGDLSLSVALTVVTITGQISTVQTGCLRISAIQNVPLGYHFVFTTNFMKFYICLPPHLTQPHPSPLQKNCQENPPNCLYKKI